MFLLRSLLSLMGPLRTYMWLGMFSGLKNPPLSCSLTVWLGHSDCFFWSHSFGNSESCTITFMSFSTLGKFSTTLSLNSFYVQTLASKYSDVEVWYFHGVPYIPNLVIRYCYFCLNMKFLKTYLQTNILFYAWSSWGLLLRSLPVLLSSLFAKVSSYLQNISFISCMYS